MAVSTWPHWTLQLLKTAGLPTSDANATWLSAWQSAERTTCARNPLNTSWPAVGATRCKRLSNGKWARTYATRGSSASAFASQFNLTDFPNLRRAFLGGDPEAYPEQDQIVLELQVWGSDGFRRQYADFKGVPIPSPASASASKAESNVSGAWTHLHRVLSTEGTATIAELERSTAALRRIERRLRRV